MRQAGADEHDDAVTRVARQTVAVAPVGVPVDTRPDAVCASISLKISYRQTGPGSRRSRYRRTLCVRSKRAAWRDVK
jgi:hypothetical protein